jgi:hypothetical protein
VITVDVELQVVVVVVVVVACSCDADGSIPIGVCCYGYAGQKELNAYNTVSNLCAISTNVALSLSLSL